MLGTIQFYNQFCPVAIKISDIATDRVLSFELNGVSF